MEKADIIWGSFISMKNGTWKHELFFVRAPRTQYLFGKIRTHYFLEHIQSMKKSHNKNLNENDTDITTSVRQVAPQKLQYMECQFLSR